MIDIVEGYLNGVGRKDLEQVASSEEVTFKGPTRALLERKGVVKQYLESTSPVDDHVLVNCSIVENDQLVTAFHIVTLQGSIPALDHFVVAQGLLHHIRLPVIRAC